jgi:hypothetical protein
MAGNRIPLMSAAYAGKSVISSGQECINLYAENVAEIDPQAPTAMTYYLTPGTTLYAQNTQYIFKARGCYRTSSGTAYYVVGQNVYVVGSDNTLTIIGIIADRPSLVKFKDNGLVVVLVDGVNGYVIDMASNNFAQITDANFYGADYVELLDTFFVFNRPSTNQFYITASNANFTLLSTTGAFNPLDIAAKSGFNDPIVGITAVHRQLQLIGNLTTEIWIGTGAADFYFQQVQGAFINHGCAAKYSIANQDVLTFFIQQDLQGNGLVVQLQDYTIKEISTPRIVEEFKAYSTLTDAIGFCYQIQDHAFYELVFPTANKGWLYDLKTGQWSEKNWTDGNGNLLRPRENCSMFAFGKILVGDWESGNLLEMSKFAFTDYSNLNAVSPIVRVRTFPHIISDNARFTINSFDADMQFGTIADQTINPLISIALSYNKGVSYSDPVYQSMGMTGKFSTVASWNRLGQGRDIVIKLQWSEALDTALNGGFITRKKART